MHCEEGRSRVRGRRRGHIAAASRAQRSLSRNTASGGTRQAVGRGQGSRQRAARAKVLTWIKPAMLGEQQGGQCGRRREFPREDVARGGGREAAGIRSSRPLRMVDLL